MHRGSLSRLLRRRYIYGGRSRDASFGGFGGDTRGDHFCVGFLVRPPARQRGDKGGAMREGGEWEHTDNLYALAVEDRTPRALSSVKGGGGGIGIGA